MSVHQSRRLVLYPDLNRRVLLVGLVKEAILAEQDQVADAVGISHLLDDPSAFFALLKMRRFANVETPRIGQAKAERQVVCNPVEAANGGIQQRRQHRGPLLGVLPSAPGALHRRSPQNWCTLCRCQRPSGPWAR